MRRLSRSKQILVTGTIAYDHLFTYDSTFLEQLREATMLPVLSVSFQPRRYEKRYGGTGANIAWNIALLGGSPLLVGDVGADGKEYVKILKQRGIDVSGVETNKTSMTSTGVSCTDPRQHQMWFFYQGADAVGHWPDLKKKASDISYAIIGARHCPKMIEALEWCKKNNIPRLFDPGQYIMDFTADDLRQAISLSTGIIVNEFEWGMIKKRLGATPAGIIKQAEYLIITRGEKGHQLYMRGKKMQSFPRCNCDNPVNPTGAGDAFRAGLILGFTRGWTLEQAGKLGAAIASFVVEEEGTHLDTLNMNHLRKRVREAYGESLPALPV